MNNNLPAKKEVEIREKNRFTEFVDPNSEKGMKCLYGWLDWFRSRGIPAALHHSRVKGYAVYREGLLREE